MSKTLADYAVGRDNNLNLIRFIAASLVLISHSYPLSLGKGAEDPLKLLIDKSMGAIAVDVFFIISGFLVTASLIYRKGIIAFAWARILRIYPALIVAMLFCVFVVGYLVTSLSFQEYAADNMTLKYLAKNIFLFIGVEYKLPEVFLEIPYPGAVNGSLWTLPWEVRMYASLVMIWLFVKWLSGGSERFLKQMIIAIALFTTVVSLLDEYFNIISNGQISSGFSLGSMFFLGAALFVLQKRIVLSTEYALWVLIGLIALMVLTEHYVLFYTVAIPYLVMYVAYVPEGKIRGFNRMGDYSYGMYIYAFPMQQSVALIFAGISPYMMMGAAFIPTFLLAILSWHLVEKRCLKLKFNFKHS